MAKVKLPVERMGGTENTTQSKNDTNKNTENAGSSALKNWTYEEFKYDPFKASSALNSAYADRDVAKNAWMNFGGFTPSDALNMALNNKANAENAVKNYGEFQYVDQSLLDKYRDQYLNRGPFNYDLNGDALYQQYKNQYMNLGNQAMMDTMGQAAAMTGGYGNSYAQTAGQQTYQGYLQQLNDKVPELYQLALSKYTQEGQDLYNKYGLLNDDRNTQYGMWNDAYNKLVAERDYAGTDYYNRHGLEYDQYKDKYGMAVDKYNALEAAANNLYNREYGQYSDSRDLAYKTAQDAVAQGNWQKEFDASQKNRDESVTGNYTDINGNPITPAVREPEYKTPTSAMYEKALQAYGDGGQAGLDKYLETLPDYDVVAIDSYVSKHGQLPISQRTFTKTKDTYNGGFNWFGEWNVDHNDEVTDQYGNVYKIDDLPQSMQMALTKLEKGKKYTGK